MVAWEPAWEWRETCRERFYKSQMNVGRCDCRIPPTSAIWYTPAVHRTKREGALRVDSSPCGKCMSSRSPLEPPRRSRCRPSQCQAARRRRGEAAGRRWGLSERGFRVKRVAVLNEIGGTSDESDLPSRLAVGSGAACAEEAAPTPNPLDVIPDKMPFSVPYGPPISLARAQAAIAAAVSEAEKRGRALNVAVFEFCSYLVAFERMDGAQLASIAIAQHKARAAVKFRRPTKAFEELIQKNDYKYQLTLDDIIASRGGIPLVEDGKLIGAIGCSGGANSQDEAACRSARTINK